MGSAPVRRDPQSRVASSVRRGAMASAPGSYRIPSRSQAGRRGSSGDWVVVEPEADITAKGHAYISFDPAGTYP